MKKLLAGFCCFLLVNSATAQQPLYDKDQLKKELSKPRNNRPATDFGQLTPTPIPEKTGSEPADTARFVSANNLGDVYRLPQDNMLCLKPSNVEATRNPLNPPVRLIKPAIPPFLQQMPNVYGGKPLIFKKPPAQNGE